MCYCQVCGVAAETRDVSFSRHIGLFVAGLTKSIKGRLCKRCVQKYFWEYTLVTAVLGWWGIFSAILTPFFLLGNGIQFLSCLDMKEPGTASAKPAPYAELVPDVQEVLPVEAIPCAIPVRGG